MLLSKSTFSKSKTLGQVQGELTCSSGYIADASSARTPGIFLQQAQGHGKGEEQEDEEITGLFDIMSDFQKNAGLLPKTNSTAQKGISTLDRPSEDQFLQVRNSNQSLQGNTTDISRLAGGEPTPYRLRTPSTKEFFSRTKASFLEASTLNDRSTNCSMLPPPTLSASYMNLPEPVLELTQASPGMELDEPELELSQNVTIFEEIEVPYNPSDTSINRLRLVDLKVPVAQRHGYYAINANVPQIKANSMVQVGPTRFIVKECKGEGGYGKVFRASSHSNDTNPNETIAEMDSVLKVQKPQPNEWEFYVCTELHQRLSSEEDKQWFMSIPRCYVFNDGSVFVSEHQPFTLLDVCNKVGELGDINCREILALYFTIEMLHVLEKLQKAKIIHADIKPENFMIQDMPQLKEVSSTSQELFGNLKPSLILIDFGVSIDMAILPPKAIFNFKFEKAENMINEMLNNKPWNYQIDYFGVASIAHIILYGTYMKIANDTGRYEPAGKPKRWWNAELWNSFFGDFLDIQDCASLPDVVQTRKKFEEFFFQKYRTRFPSIISDLKNMLYRK